jgi:DNA-binding transcriptional MerR regulator
MDNLLDINEVARRTGLTSRALRFYEARGLAKPLRTGKGRRPYGLETLERINQIVSLKRAGLTLAQIETLLAAHSPDLAQLIDAQRAALEARQATIAEAIQVLAYAKSRIERGEPVDVATFCELIRRGDAAMETSDWNREVVERLFAKEQTVERLGQMVAVLGSMDPQTYKQQWAELSQRIEAALPIDPASAEAQTLYEAFSRLTEPFKALTRPGAPVEQDSKISVDQALARMDEWKSDRSEPSLAVFQFLFSMGQREKAGKAGQASAS